MFSGGDGGVTAFSARNIALQAIIFTGLRFYRRNPILLRAETIRLGKNKQKNS